MAGLFVRLKLNLKQDLAALGATGGRVSGRALEWLLVPRTCKKIAYLGWLSMSSCRIHMNCSLSLFGNEFSPNRYGQDGQED